MCSNCCRWIRGAPINGQICPRPPNSFVQAPDLWWVWRILGAMESTDTTTPRLDTLQRVELTEGVAIRLRTAGPMVRMLAMAIDLCIQFGIMMGLSMLYGLGIAILGFDLAEMGTGLFLIAMFLLAWGYFIFFEIGKRNATPGKRCLGIRVARFSGAPPTLRQIVTRNLLRFADFFPLVPVASVMPIPTYAFGLIACSLTRNFQRLGDLAANTVVIYVDKQPIRHSVALDIEPRAPQIALTREEQLSIASFTDRIADWSAERRREMADILEPITGAKGEEGVRRLLGIGLWIRTDRDREGGAKRKF
ncbi:MAG: putative RDD family membrane protein YckC [Verrucomicrobiales bacterium]|jgi:uncharacterized RDD family membrane protein YckC